MFPRSDSLKDERSRTEFFLRKAGPNGQQSLPGPCDTARTSTGGIVVQSSFIGILVTTGMALAAVHTAHAATLTPLHGFACSDEIGTDILQTVTCPDGVN